MRPTRPGRQSREHRSGSPDELTAAILKIVGDATDGVPTEEICRQLGKTPQELGDTFEGLGRDGSIRGFAGLWISPRAFRAIADRFLRSLSEYHAAYPETVTVPPSEIAKAAKLSWVGKPLDRLVSALATEGELSVFDSGVRANRFRPRLPSRTFQLLERVAQAIDRNLTEFPLESELADAVSVPRQAIHDIVRIGVEAGELVQVADGMFTTPARLARLQKQIRSLVGPKDFGAAEMRRGLGVSRSKIVPLLEYFDAIGFTVRVEDGRRIKLL